MLQTRWQSGFCKLCCQRNSFFFLLHVVEVHKFAMNKSDVNTSKISEHGCSNPDDNPRFHLAWANQVLFHSIADKRYAENRTRRSLHGIEFPS